MTRVCVVVLLCIAWMTSAGHAQTRATTGDLRVIAADESALPLPGVRLSLVHAETGLERTAVTGQDGDATVSALAIGRYAMRADLDAFKPVTIDDVTIELGATIEVRMTLPLASRAETVDVVAPQPLVDIQRTAVSTIINEQQIGQLPIDRRNYISFAVLAAGVTTDRTLNQGPAETSGLSFSGQSARANNITVEVVAHSYSAEFGKAAGGAVSGSAHRAAASAW